MLSKKLPKKLLDVRNLWAFLIGFVATAMLLNLVSGCKRRDIDPAFLSQMSNSHIKGCGATAKSVSNVQDGPYASAWSVLCQGDRGYVCSLTKSEGNHQVACSLQTIPAIRESMLEKE